MATLISTPAKTSGPASTPPAQQLLDYHRTIVDRAEQGDTRLALLATECRRLIHELAEAIDP
ncbi:MAG: hypothetical protein HZA46_13365 [Planctomycetales bacterium]|nr:hypothetical protein [Planctomycetales bacterium]